MIRMQDFWDGLDAALNSVGKFLDDHRGLWPHIEADIATNAEHRALLERAFETRATQAEAATALSLSADRTTALAEDGREAEDVSDYFGLCPTCHKTDGYLNYGPDHWFFCIAHKVCWCAGANLFSAWHDQTPEEKHEVGNRLGTFREVRPFSYPRYLAPSRAAVPAGARNADADDDIPF